MITLVCNTLAGLGVFLIAALTILQVTKQSNKTDNTSLGWRKLDSVSWND